MQNQPNQDLFAEIAGAGELTDYADNFDQGEHIVALNNYEIKKTREYGTMVSVDFIVLESSCHRKGEARGDAWFVGKPGDDGLYAKKRALAFGKAAVRALGGDPEDPTPVQLPNGQVIPKGLAQVQQTLAEMNRKDQPWRGLVLRISTSSRKSKKTQRDHKNNAYAPVQQTVAQIHESRARIERSAPAQPAVQPQPAIAAQPMTIAPATVAAQPMIQPVAAVQPVAAPMTYVTQPTIQATTPTQPAAQPWTGSMLGGNPNPT